MPISRGLTGVVLFFMTGCSFPTITHNQSEVIIEEIDLEASLRVAQCELERNAWDSILGLWAIRDQRIDAKLAERISTLYFDHIDDIESDFGVWHLTWAVSNFYRNGDPPVQAALREAFADAKHRARALNKKKADEKVNGEEVYMGFSHVMGYRYARKHIVAPGNRRFLQSFNDYRHAESCR